MKERNGREPIYYIAYFLFTVITVVFNYLAISGGDPSLPNHRKVNVGDWFTGSFFDWAGLVIFDAGILAIILGFLGVWSLSEEPNTTRWNFVWGAILVLGVALILLF